LTLRDRLGRGRARRRLAGVVIVEQQHLAPVEDRVRFSRDVDEDRLVGDLEDLPEDDVAPIHRGTFARRSRVLLVFLFVPSVWTTPRWGGVHVWTTRLPIGRNAVPLRPLLVPFGQRCALGRRLIGPLVERLRSTRLPGGLCARLLAAAAAPSLFLPPRRRRGAFPVVRLRSRGAFLLVRLRGRGPFLLARL
jgi:hypothetical protein